MNPLGIVVRGAKYLVKGAKSLKKSPKKAPDYVVDNKGVARRPNQKPPAATKQPNPQQGTITVDSAGTARKSSYPVATQGSRALTKPVAAPKSSGVNARSIAGAAVTAGATYLGLRDLQETPYDPTKVFGSRKGQEAPKTSDNYSKSFTAGSARRSFAATDPRRSDVGGRQVVSKSRSAAPAAAAITPKPIEKVKAIKNSSVKSVTTVASQANAGTAADTKFVGSGLKKAGVSIDGGMSERVSKLGEVNSSVMTADLTEAGLTKAGLAASNSGGFGGSFKRLFEGNIDQKGSVAYNKYGAGRGLAELAKRNNK